MPKYYLFFAIILLSLSCSKKNALTRVSSYGAKGDGISDDSSALQRAIDAAKSEVILDKKTYVIHRAIQLKSNLSIKGNGAKIIVDNKVKGSALIINHQDNISIEDLTLLGQKNWPIESKTTGRDKFLLQCKNAKNISLTNLTFKDHPFTAIHCMDIVGMNIENCTIANIGKYTSAKEFPNYSYDGIFLGGYESCRDITIHACTFKDIGNVPNRFYPQNDGDGIQIQTPKAGVVSQVKITDCVFQHCSARGIKMQSGESINIARNKFRDGMTGIGMTMVNNIQHIDITENNFSNLTQATATNHKGMVASNIRITGNTASECSYFYRTSGGSLLSQSVITDNEASEIGRCFVDLKAKHVKIQGNRIKGYAKSGDKSYHMAMLIAAGSDQIEILDNSIEAVGSTATAIYIQPNIAHIRVENNEITIPKGNPRQRIIVDKSKNLSSRGKNRINDAKH